MLRLPDLIISPLYYFFRQRDDYQAEIQNLEDKKRPLLNEKDDLLKIILKLEDTMKKARGEVNRIYSETNDTSDLQRQVVFVI